MNEDQTNTKLKDSQENQKLKLLGQKQIQIQYQKQNPAQIRKMHTMDSPITASHLNQGQKNKHHESPITKLTNLTDLRPSYQPLTSKNQNILNDRSNEVFVQKNAAKYVEEPYERKHNREKEIDEIRKKYYENSNNKASRPLSQMYDRYEVKKENDNRSSKRDENGREIRNDNIKRPLLLSNRYYEAMVPNRMEDNHYGNNPYNNQNKQNQTTTSYSPSLAYEQKTTQKSSRSNLQLTFQPNQLNPAATLDRISEASNSNYETVTKTLQTFSPERNRIKSSFVVDDRSSKRKLTDENGYYFVESFRNKENQSTAIVKETTSVYNESATRVSHVNSYYDRDSAKSSKIDPRTAKHEPSYLKPFSLEDNSSKSTVKETPIRPVSRQPYNQSVNSYPTIYDNFLPRNSTPSTQQKQAKKQDQIFTRPRTYTEDKKYPVDKVNERRDPSKIYDPQDQVKRRVLKFEDDEKIKEIQKRLKEREADFKKREEQLRTKCENQYDRRTDYSQNKQLFMKNPEINQNANQLLQGVKTLHPQQRPNVQKEIERLSLKIQQFQNRKKELNLPGRNIDHQVAGKSKPVQIKIQGSNRQFEDARKALEEFRECGKVKSTSEVYQVAEYQILSSTNNEKSNCAVKYEEDISFHQRYLKNIQSPTQFQNRKCEFIENTKPIYSQRTLPTPKRIESSSFGFQLFKIQSEGDETSSHTSKVTVNSTTSNKTNSKECKNQFEMHRRTDDGIQQRKKKLQENPKTGVSQEMKRLVSLLSQQTIQDQQFRNCKIWFQNERNENKWKELKRELKELNIKFTEMKDGTIAEFYICEDENNPFFSVNQQSKFSYQTLVKSYIAAKTFWEENIVKKFNRNQLKVEEFNLEKFDLEKKGFINMEDLVRFLNFQSGNFYRNRDLVLIFKRLANECGDKYEKALDIEKIFRTIAY